MIEYICSFEEEYGFLVSASMKYGEELIRCKDCKYNNDSRCSYYGGAGYRWVVANAYCSCAERKEE